jgi:hypothetical protein
MEVVSVNGNVLEAKLSLVSVDEVYMWISPAYFACELHESTASLRDDEAARATRSALADAGLYAEADAEDDDDGLARYNEEAAAFIASVVVGPVQDGKLVGKNGGALRVERTDRQKAPWVAVTITATRPELLAHLKPGASWETAPIGFGALPEKD